jgi:hypothetical protein
MADLTPELRERWPPQNRRHSAHSTRTSAIDAARGEFGYRPISSDKRLSSHEKTRIAASRDPLIAAVAISIEVAEAPATDTRRREVTTALVKRFALAKAGPRRWNQRSSAPSIMSTSVFKTPACNRRRDLMPIYSPTIRVPATDPARLTPNR